MPTTPSGSPIRDYVAVLRVRKLWVLGVTAVVFGSALAYSLSKTPLYQSTAQVLVRPITLSPTDSASGGFVPIPAEKALAGSSLVASTAAKRLGTTAPPGRVVVKGDQDSVTLQFQATSSTPSNARAIAQAYAESYIDVRRNQVLQDLQAASDPIEKRIQTLNKEIAQTQVQLSAATQESRRSALQISLASLLSERGFLLQKLNELILPENLHVGEILQPASLPDRPSSPDHLKAALYAFFVGLGLGVGFAFARDRLDDTVRDRVAFEDAAGTKVLGVIPRPTPRANVIGASASRERAEVYGGLRSSVGIAVARSGARTLLITDAHGETPRSLVVAHLGLSLAAAGTRVLLVDANLRKPQLESSFYVSPRAGLTNILAGETSPAEATVQIGGDGLRLLGTGPITDHPADLIGSDAMRTLLARLRDEGDLVLIVCPPILSASDALALAAIVDGTLLVGYLDRSTGNNVKEARRLLDQVDARVIGGVLLEKPGALRATIQSTTTYFKSVRAGMLLRSERERAANGDRNSLNQGENVGTPDQLPATDISPEQGNGRRARGSEPLGQGRPSQSE